MITLLEAFQKVAPCAGEAAVDRARNEAARLLHEQLRRLSWSTPLLRQMSDDERDEVVAVVLLRLVQAGPRGARAADPCQSAAVRRFLRTSLENSLKDLIRARSQHKHVQLEDEPGAQQPAPESDASPDRQLERRRAAGELQSAMGDLVQVVLPWLQANRRKDAAARIRHGTESLLRLDAGATTVELLLKDALQEPASPAELRRARYALYQQLHRTLQDLTASIAELQQQGALSQDRVRALLTVVGELKLRKEAP